MRYEATNQDFEDDINFKIIEEINNDVIIRTQDMNHWKITIDLGKEIINFLNQQPISFNFWNQVITKPIKLIKNIKIQPKSSIIAKMNTKLSQGIGRIFTPKELQLQKSIYIQQGIIKNQEIAYI